MGDANGGGEARVVYLYSSPLVRRARGRKERMVQLDTEKEQETIRETLKNAKLPIRFRAMVATPDRVGEILNDGYQMIHYVGHGDGGRLSFESDDDRQCGIMETFEVNALENLLRSKHAKTQLVFLSSCCSELSGNAFVRAGVPHVVAVKTKEEVTDEVARLFSQAFYNALFGTQRHSVKNAFDIASSIVCNKLNAGNSKQQGGPFILLPSDGNHDVPIFDQQPGKFIEETPPLPKVCPCLPRARSPYLGEEALQKVADALVNPFVACVTVVGGRGSGKTEMIIQGCKYVRERRRFDAIFFATWDKPAVGWRTPEDLCSLVGQALGMEPAPSSIKQLADLLFKQDEGGPPPRKVLLVLDGVGALVGELDQEARDELLDFLCSLCKGKDSYNLKLLVTSSVRLEHDSSTRFRPGSEQVLNIAPLRGTDPAQLFFNAASRKLTRRELEVESGYSQADLLKALQGHLVKAEGHPGTLVDLASSVGDENFMVSSLATEAVRILGEFNSMSPPSTPTFNNHDSFFGDDASFGGGGNRGWEGGRGGHHLLPNDGGTHGTSTDGPGGRHDHHSSRPQQVSRRGAPHQRLQRGDRQRNFAQQELRGYAPHQRLQRGDGQRRIAHQGLLQRSIEYVDPQAFLQQHPHGTASEAALRDLGCYPVWVQAIENAQADGRGHGSGARPLSRSAVCGRTDRAPLKCIFDALRGCLNQQLVVSGSHFRTEDDSLYDFLPDERVELAGSDSDDAVDTLTQHGISDENMGFVKKRLRREQSIVACRGGDTRASGPELDDDGDEQGIISIEAFVHFCEWWTPVMATLSQLRGDRRSTALVGKHWFVGRQAASEMLSQKEAGTFLLRFSETRAGALVISLKENVPSTEASTSSAHPPRGLDVVNCLVKVEGGGRCCFIHEQLKVDESGLGLPVCNRRRVGSYTSLHDLIVTNEKMQTLYPNTPKERAFE